MDNRFYVPGAGWDLLTRTLRNVKDGDNITDEYYAVVLEIITATRKQTKLKFYVRMLQPCDPSLQGTPHDFCVNPLEEAEELYSYYTRQHTLCEILNNTNHKIKKGTIVKIKLNKKKYLNKTYVDTATSVFLGTYDEETSKSMFPNIYSLVEKKTKSIKNVTQKNLTTATTNGNSLEPKETRCFKLNGKDVLNGFMSDDLLYTIDQYCKENGIEGDYIVKKLGSNRNGADIKLYKGIIPDYIQFCKYFDENITSKVPKIKLLVGEGYRPFEVQKELFMKKPNLAKPPGKSPHSWGLAIDIIGADVDNLGNPLKPTPEQLMAVNKETNFFPDVQEYNQLSDKEKASLIYYYNIENSHVVKVMKGGGLRLQNPFKNRTNKFRESWHFQVEPHIAFDNFSYKTKCPVPGSEPQTEVTTGADEGIGESNVPEGEENNPNDTADTNQTNPESTEENSVETTTEQQTSSEILEQ